MKKVYAIMLLELLSQKYVNEADDEVRHKLKVARLIAYNLIFQACKLNTDSSGCWIQTQERLAVW